MTGSFMLSQGAGQKLEFALNRNDCGASVVEWLSAGENLQKVRMLVEGTAELVVKPLVEAVREYAKNLGEVVVKFASPPEMAGFTFTTRAGLWVDGAFGTIFGTDVEGVGTDSVTLNKYQLVQSASDRNIVTEIGQGVWFKGKDEAKVLKRTVASLVLQQWGGKPGTLLNNGYANLFYYEDESGKQVVVHVRLYSDVREWHVHVWRFGDSQWRAGYAAFSRN